jgi:hypothetical protein
MAEVLGNGGFTLLAVVVGWFLGRGTRQARQRAAMKQELDLWQTMPEGHQRDALLRHVSQQMGHYLRSDADGGGASAVPPHEQDAPQHAGRVPSAARGNATESRRALVPRNAVLATVIVAGVLVTGAILQNLAIDGQSVGPAPAPTQSATPTSTVTPSGGPVPTSSPSEPLNPPPGDGGSEGVVSWMVVAPLALLAGLTLRVSWDRLQRRRLVARAERLLSDA